MMDNIIKDLGQKFGEANIQVYESSKQDTIIVHVDVLLALCKYLRDTEGYYFDFLANITALDYYPENKFAVVYNLSSLPYQKQLTLRVELPIVDRSAENLPEIPSVSSVWRTADWHEREAFDLMGIYFTGHPDLRRILLPDDWQGFPLRKDYEDAETYHGIPIKGE